MPSLQVTVGGCVRLQDTHVFGKPAPYVELLCKGIPKDKKIKTSVSSEVHNPTWNETFRIELNLNQLNLQKDELHVVVKDDSMLRKEAHMGECRIRLSLLVNGVVRDQRYQLREISPCDDVENPEIHLRLLAVDFGIAPNPEDCWKVTNDITKDPQLAPTTGDDLSGDQSATRTSSSNIPPMDGLPINTNPVRVVVVEPPPAADQPRPTAPAPTRNKISGDGSGGATMTTTMSEVKVFDVNDLGGAMRDRQRRLSSVTSNDAPISLATPSPTLGMPPRGSGARQTSSHASRLTSPNSVSAGSVSSRRNWMRGVSDEADDNEFGSGGIHRYSIRSNANTDSLMTPRMSNYSFRES